MASVGEIPAGFPPAKVLQLFLPILLYVIASLLHRPYLLLITSKDVVC